MNFFVHYTLAGLELTEGPFGDVADANLWADDVKASGAVAVTVEATQVESLDAAVAAVVGAL